MSLTNVRPPDKSAYQKLFSYFSTKTYVVGTQKNRLQETVLSRTQNMFKLMGKKIITILSHLLNWTYVTFFSRNVQLPTREI